MSGTEAQMWGQYEYNGFTVRVIQKWVDPYGKPMIRIADIGDSERAMGLAETEFLAGAKLLAEQGELPE